MAKRPPMSSGLNVCKNLKWTKHFKPQTKEEYLIRVYLQDVHPYPDLPTIIYLCVDSYNDHPDAGVIPDSFKRLWSVSTSSSNGGYFGAIYVNKSAKQVVLVHRGTNSMAAVKADVDIWSNKISSQMLSAMTCTHQLKCKMEKSFPKWKLIIAGHSLGSYLTDVSIFSHMYLEPNECGKTFHKINDIENATSVTILPYGIGIDGPGSFDIIWKLRDMTDVRYGNGKLMRVKDLPVDHYVGVPNVVNSQYEQVGGLFQIPMKSKNNWIIQQFLDNFVGKLSTHKLDNFIAAFTEKDLPQVKQIIDFPKNQSERASVNFQSNTDSRTPRNVDDDYTVERYQATDILKGTTELRFFCSHVQKLLYDFDKVKRYAKQLTFLLKSMSAEGRESINSILTSLQMDEREAVVVCSADGMNKQKLIPWINEFFDSYPRFIDKDNVICSMCEYFFTCQTRLQFRRDPFNMELNSKSPYIIEAGNTSIAASEVVATLKHLDKSYLLLKASQIKILEEIFKFEDDISNYAVLVVEEDNEHDTSNFIRNFDSSQIIKIKYAEDAPVVRCKLDDLTDECKEDLLSTELRLHGKTVKLHDFIGSDNMSDALMHSLLRGGLNDIPECIDTGSSNTYVDIERRLKISKKGPQILSPTFTVRKAMEHSKILIIADLPGSGKSTMVTQLSSQTNEWVIRVKLNEKSSVLEKWHKEGRNVKNSYTEDLLSELARISPLQRPLSKSVIEDWESVVKICVIFDAFDEVKADYTELVIEVLKELKHKRKISNIIVTTRPHLRCKLEESLQTKSCPLSQFSFNELDQLHRQGKLKESLHTESGSLNRSFNDELAEFLFKDKRESSVEIELIRFLHDELIDLHIKRQFGKPFNRNSRSHEELKEVHSNGKIEKSLQTEWSPLSKFTIEHKEIIDLHLNGVNPLHPESPASRSLETFLHEKVFKHLRDRMEKLLKNELNPSHQLTCTQLIKNCDDMNTQSLDAKLSFVIDFSFEELLKLHIIDTRDKSVEFYSLDTFSNEEGIDFMTKLIANPDYPRDKVKEIFEKFTQNIDTDVRQAPMMLQLIASKMQEINEDSAHSLSVHSLYSDHIEQVYRQYVEVKAGATNNSEITREIQEKLFSSNLGLYYHFALNNVLHMSDAEIESYGLKYPYTEIDRERILRHGLLVGTDFSVQFEHRTYAEFFVAKWLMSDRLKPQAYEIFFDVILKKRDSGNDTLVFLDGEAGRCSSAACGISRRQFFEQIANYYCVHNERGIISSERKKLTRYIFDGIKKFCGENTLQKVLLKGCEHELLFETDAMENFNFIMAMYHEAGLTSQSVESRSSVMYQILKSNVDRIINYSGHNEECFLALLKLVEEYLDYDEVLQLIRDLNRTFVSTRYKSSCDFHIKTFKWQIQFLRTSNREDELTNLIFDTNHEGAQSFFLWFSHFVHQSLKEMNSPVLNDLPKVFETDNYDHSSVWESEVSKKVFDFESMRYVCLVMFPDQYGKHAANEYKVQFLDHECKMLKFVLNKASVPFLYVPIAALMLKMAITSGLSDEDVETVLDVILQHTRDTDCLSDHKYVIFAALGTAVGMKIDRDVPHSTYIRNIVFSTEGRQEHEEINTFGQSDSLIEMDMQECSVPRSSILSSLKKGFSFDFIRSIASKASPRSSHDRTSRKYDENVFFNCNHSLERSFSIRAQFSQSSGENKNYLANKPPMNWKLNVCKNLKWTKHFEPRMEGEPSSRPSMQDIHPFPDLSTISYLCWDTYNDHPDTEIIPHSFKRLWSVGTSSNGYFGAIYVNESAKQVVLVHRGADSSSVSKVDTDIWSIMLSAMTCTHQLKCKMKKSFPEWKLIIAGHSLGSYLADVSIFSHMCLEPNKYGTTFHKINDIENATSITILPYGIGIDGPGSFDIISKLRDMTDVRYEKLMRVEDLPVDHYMGATNFVNSQYRHVGGLFQIPMGNDSILGKFLDNCADKSSTHKLDIFVSAFNEKDLSQVKQDIDFPRNRSERMSVTGTNSSTSLVVNATERNQVADVSKGVVDLRFFCSHVQKLLIDFHKLKLHARQWTLVLENVSADDRESINKILTTLRIDERNAIVSCSADGMDKQKLIPWINEFFDSYPQFMDMDTVIRSICAYVFSMPTTVTI